MSENVIKAWAKMNSEIKSIGELAGDFQPPPKFKIKTKPFSAMASTSLPKNRALTAFIKPKSNIQNLNDKNIINFTTKPFLVNIHTICSTITKNRNSSAYEKSHLKAMQNIFFMKNKFKIQSIEFFVELYRLRAEYSEIPFF